MRKLLFLVALIGFFTSCEDAAYYQKSFAFKNNKWDQNVKPKFEIEFQDTTKLYDFILTLTPNEKTSLPELILVTKSGGLPLDENNGTQVLTMPAGGDCSPEFPLEINFTFNFIGKLANWRWRLFTANHEHCEWLILEDE